MVERRGIISSAYWLLFILTLTTCEVIGDVLKDGFYSGIFLIVAIIGLIIFIVARLSRKK